MKNIIASIKLYIASVIACVVIYGGVNLLFAQTFFNSSANGSLITRNSKIVGSSFIGQNFESPKYFKGRVSAVNYNAASSGASNLAPTSDVLKKRACETIKNYAAKKENPLPADLASASGSGLDPHITFEAALYQIDTVAKARNVEPKKIEGLLNSKVVHSGGFFTDMKLINVLELNILLDETFN